MPAVPTSSFDGAEPAPERADLTGLEYIEAVRDGRFPLSPMARTIGWRILEVEEGRVTLCANPGAHLYNHKTLHGGAMAAMLDGAMAFAVNSALPRKVRCRTLDLQASYLDAPTAESGELYARAEVIQLRNRIALAEGRIEDGEENFLAHGTARFIIRRPA